MNDLLTLFATLPVASMMSTPFFEGEMFGKEVVINLWKIVGYLGVLMFGCRWLPQFLASRKAKMVRMPRVFWIMSVCGSLLLLSYFTFGKTDSVGILSNLFPAFVASYNLLLDIRNGRSERAQAAVVAEK